MRAFLGLLLIAALAACASNASRHCTDLAGSGWTRLSRPPANAAALFAMEGLPDEPDALWFTKDPDQVLACIYAGGLTSPGCGAATVYQYAKIGDRWTFQSTAMEACSQDF